MKPVWIDTTSSTVFAPRSLSMSCDVESMVSFDMRCISLASICMDFVTAEKLFIALS